MAKIYVSSTFNDLQEYREQVRTSLRSMGHEDIAMEYYTAGEKRPVDKCLDDVAAADIYVGIFAWRYGYIPDGYNQSITEQEYRKAIELNKPCLIFILKDDAVWPMNRVEIPQMTRMTKFRQELCNENTTGMFTDKNDLAKQVTTAIYNWALEHGHIPATVANIPKFDLEKYYEALRVRYHVLALEGLTPPQKEEYLQIQLRSVFVEQSVRENPPPVELPKEIWQKLSQEKEIHPDDLPFGIKLEDVRKARQSYYEKPARLVFEVLTDSRYQRTIILGDPGSGKSTLARYIMLSLIDPEGNEKLRHAYEGYLPLLIELRSYIGMCAEGNCGSFLEYFEYLGETEGYSLTKETLNNHLKNEGHAITIFDGLDEIFDPERREQITRQIVGFCNDYPKARIIVTSRVIGYRRRVLSVAGFTHFTLQDLDEKQVESFILRWYDLAMSDRPDEAKERCERILKSFKESPPIRQLASNPMLLTIMAIIGKHQELPRERWKLYDHAASVLIQHWDVNKHLKNERIEADFIGEDDKKELLRRLAYQMQGGEGGLAGNYIRHEGLQDEFEGYLRERYSQAPDRAKIIAQTMIQQFRERNFILSLYGANLYGFVHRAFLEYFCASAFVYEFEKTKTLTLEQLKKDVYHKHSEDQNWHEVLRLICGMIDEKWAGEIIDYLIIRKTGPSRQFRPPKFISDSLELDFDSNETQNLGVGLAVQCLGEVRNIGSIAITARRVLENVCEMFDNSSPYVVFTNGLLIQQILLTAELIGTNWPYREILSDWLEQRISKELHSQFPSMDTGTFVGLVGSNLDSILNLLLEYTKHRNNDDRILALSALTTGWYSNPKTLLILRQSATNDKDSRVRLVAFELLIKNYYEDKENLSLAYDTAIKDLDAHVRRGILNILLENFRGAIQTLKLVQERIFNDPNHNARADAIIALARNWPNRPETLSVLNQCAETDTNSWVQSVATGLITKYETKSK